MLRKRVITALWGIPLLIAAIWFDYPLPWFTVLIAVWGVLAAFEFYKLVGATNTSPLTYFGIVWTLLFILTPHFEIEAPVPLLLTSAIIIPLVWLLLRRHRVGTFTDWAWTIAGILYVGWLLSHLVALRGVDDGRNWIFFALFTTFASDTTAFFIGRAIGRYHLAPRISPGKTWEGAIAGICGAIIISLFFTLPTPLGLPIGYISAVFLGILVSIFGQLGDLVESLLKRNIGVKESSDLIPGHGGFLDRMDSVVFAGIVVYYYVIWVIP